jgi:small-conductance mechanosensitive channel
MIGDWYTITFQSLQSLWQGMISFLPALIGAIVIMVIGWFVSMGIGRLITEILRKLKFNQIFERGVWKEALAKAEFKVDASGFVGAVCKWILIIVFLLAAVEILGFEQFADFLKNVLGYLPNVIVAVLIFVVAVIVADIIEKVVRAAVEGMKIGYGHLVGMIAKWSIWIFAILAILLQLKIAPELVQTLFTGLVAMLVISAGLAFGLGGKDLAAEVLRNLHKKLKGE